MSIESKKRVLIAGLLSFIIFFVPAQHLTAAESSVALHKKYFEAEKKAVESESKGDLTAALESYKSALEWLKMIEATYPDWFPEIVESRLTECGSNINRVSGEIKTGTESGMETSHGLVTRAIEGKETDVEGVYSSLAKEICRKADDFYENGLYTEACLEYEKVLKLAPDNPRANFQLGLIYLEHIRDEEKMEKLWGRYRAVAHSDMGDMYSGDGKYLTAIEQYSEALNAEPCNTSIRRRLANVYSKQMCYPEAVKEYQAVLSAEPGDLYSRFQLARTHAELGSLEEAISELDFIRERDGGYPGAGELYARLKAKAGDREGAIACYAKVIADKPDGIGPYIELAKLFKEEKDELEMAVETLTLGLSRFPESTQLAYELGRCYVEIGDHRKARAIYGGILKKSPDDVHSLVGLGVISFNEGDVKKAEAYLGKALEVEPESPLALFRLASCRESRGDREGAIGCLEKAIEYEIDDLDAYRKLVDMYIAAGKADKAGSILKQAVQRWPTASDMRNRLTTFYIASGNRVAAAEELERYVELERRDASAFLQLGNLHYESGREGDALSAYKEAFQLNPGMKEVARKTAVLYQRRGEYEPAIETYLVAIEEEPDSPTLHNNIAVCYAKRGLFKEAIDEYEKVLSLDKGFAEVHIDMAKIYGEKLGKPKKAIEHCCRYLQLRPAGVHAPLAKEMLMAQKEAQLK